MPHLLSLLLLTPLIVLAQAVTPEERLFEALHESKPLLAEGIVLRGRINLDARNANGETSLHVAIEKSYEELTELLIKSGASLTARTRNS